MRKASAAGYSCPVRGWRYTDLPLKLSHEAEGGVKKTSLRGTAGCYTLVPWNSAAIQSELLSTDAVVGVATYALGGLINRVKREFCQDRQDAFAQDIPLQQ